MQTISETEENENYSPYNLCLKVMKLCPIYEGNSEDVTVTAEGIVTVQEMGGDLKFIVMGDTNVDDLKRFFKSVPVLRCKVQTNGFFLHYYFNFLIFILDRQSLYPMYLFFSKSANVYSPEFKIYEGFYLE